MTKNAMRIKIAGYLHAVEPETMRCFRRAAQNIDKLIDQKILWSLIESKLGFEDR